MAQELQEVVIVNKFRAIFIHLMDMNTRLMDEPALDRLVEVLSCPDSDLPDEIRPIVQDFLMRVSDNDRESIARPDSVLFALKLSAKFVCQQNRNLIVGQLELVLTGLCRRVLGGQNGFGAIALKCAAFELLTRVTEHWQELCSLLYQWKFFLSSAIQLLAEAPEPVKHAAKDFLISYMRNLCGYTNSTRHDVEQFIVSLIALITRHQNKNVESHTIEATVIIGLLVDLCKSEASGTSDSHIISYLSFAKNDNGRLFRVTFQKLMEVQATHQRRADMMEQLFVLTWFLFCTHGHAELKKIWESIAWFCLQNYTLDTELHAIAYLLESLPHDIVRSDGSTYPELASFDWLWDKLLEPVRRLIKLEVVGNHCVGLLKLGLHSFHTCTRKWGAMSLDAKTSILMTSLELLEVDKSEDCHLTVKSLLLKVQMAAADTVFLAKRYGCLHFNIPYDPNLMTLHCVLKHAGEKDVDTVLLQKLFHCLHEETADSESEHQRNAVRTCTMTFKDLWTFGRSGQPTELHNQASSYEVTCPNFLLGCATIEDNFVYLQWFTTVLKATMSDTKWEVRDSALQLLVTTIEQAQKSLPTNDAEAESWVSQWLETSGNELKPGILTIVWRLVKDDEGYVRTSALKAVRKMLRHMALWRLLCAVAGDGKLVFECLVNAVENDVHSNARAAAVENLHDIVHGAKKSGGAASALGPDQRHTICNTMKSVVFNDVCWEVKLKALHFWNSMFFKHYHCLVTGNSLMSGIQLAKKRKIGNTCCFVGFFAQIENVCEVFVNALSDFEYQVREVASKMCKKMKERLAGACTEGEECGLCITKELPENVKNMAHVVTEVQEQEFSATEDYSVESTLDEILSSKVRIHTSHSNSSESEDDESESSQTQSESDDDGEHSSRNPGHKMVLDCY